MNDILFEILKLVVMVSTLVITGYLIPWLKSKIGTEKMEQAEKWVKYAVLKAEQVMSGKNGTEKKSYVVEFLTYLFWEKDILITEEQLDILIEAAVKQMKMEENTSAQ